MWQDKRLLLNYSWSHHRKLETRLEVPKGTAGICAECGWAHWGLLGSNRAFPSPGRGAGTTLHPRVPWGQGGSAHSRRKGGDGGDEDDDDHPISFISHSPSHCSIQPHFPTFYDFMIFFFFFSSLTQTPAANFHLLPGRDVILRE